MSRFTDYTDNVRDGEMSWRFELLDGEGGLLASDDPADTGDGGVIPWAPSAPVVSFEPASRSVRSLSVTVAVDDSALVPVSRSSALHPEALSRVRMSAGLNIGGTITWWTQATLLVDEPTVKSDGGVVTMEVPLLDASSLLAVELATSFAFEEDEPVETVVERLLALVFPVADSYSVTPTGFTVPAGSLDAGKRLDEIVAQLLGGCGHELFVDETGLVLTRPVPPSSDDGSLERWEYGPDGLPIEDVSRKVARRFVQGLVVEGGSVLGDEPTIRRKVFDTDPASLGYYDGRGYAKIPTVKFPFLRSSPQAEEAGYGRLRRTGAGPGMVEITVPPNPALRPGDVIGIDDDATASSGTYLVQGFSVPLVITQSSRSVISARRLWRPDAGVVPPSVQAVGFETAFSDDFNRADEDLQGDGTWLEYGYSWGVVGSAAIQRYNNGWSMGMVNKPLAFSDQSASVTVVKIPTARFLGPMVRSSGGFEGYAALVEESGAAHLESWNGGTREARLLTVQTGVSPAGRTLEVRALGRTISMRLDGVEIGSVDDDRHLGSHVGILALGGPPSNAPTVDDFVAAEAT